ncbi:MAG: PAS domain S-box protein [Cytophagales bacterium]|nr:MAG: PAS domain S-box protein [Cytophagales bacterium]
MIEKNILSIAHIQDEQNRLFFKNLFEYAPISMAIVGLNGKVVEINQVFTLTFGHKIQDFYQKKFKDFCHPKDLELNYFFDKKLLNNELDFYELESRFLHQNNKYLHTILRVSLMKGNDGKAQYFLAHIVDITERKNIEEKVKQSERLFYSINHNLREAIYRSTPNKGVVYCNQAFCDLFGFDDIEEVQQQMPEMLYSNPQDREYLQSCIRQHGFFKNEEVIFKRKDGSTFWGLISGIVSGDKYEPFMYDGAITDITKLKQVEERLRKSQLQLKSKNDELKKINKELDNFVYSTGHDLKAPLTSVLGLINVMRLDMPELKENMYLAMMEKSVHKLEQFIREILDYSKNSRLQVQRERIDFQKMVNDIFHELQFMGNAEHIHKKISIEAECDFYSDEKRLMMIFNNLLSNAVRYHNLHREKKKQ